MEQRILEESCCVAGMGVVTGWAALRLHGAGYFDGLAPDGHSDLSVPLIVPPGTSLRSPPGVEVHRESLDAREVVTCYSILTTSADRAAFDAARRASDLRAAVVVLDMALAAGVVNRSTFSTYLHERAGWPGIRQVVRALELADARSMSPKETELRLIWVLDAQLPRPRCNWPVADQRRRFIGRPDLLCEELAVVCEFDGAHHRSRTRHRDDLRRDDAFRKVGLEVVRVVGADLDDLSLVLARIRSGVVRARDSNVPRTWLTKANPPPVATSGR